MCYGNVAAPRVNDSGGCHDKKKGPNYLRHGRGQATSTLIHFLFLMGYFYPLFIFNGYPVPLEVGILYLLQCV